MRSPKELAAGDVYGVLDRPLRSDYSDHYTAFASSTTNLSWPVRLAKVGP
jgi:hypothetical protein